MRSIKGFLISLTVLIAMPLLLLGFVNLNEQEHQQARAHYAEREILRAVFASTRSLKRSGDPKKDVAATQAVQRYAFLEKLPIGTSREEINRRLTAEGIGCVPESSASKRDLQCMATGHSNDFRWFFVLRFSNEDKLLDADIRTLKGA